jgi:hypothetical protein
MLGAWPFDKGVRGAMGAWARSLATNPLRAAKKVHMQSILVIQPIDILEDGRDDMCDGCPDMTVHEGKLVWSCRLEEPRAFGQFVRAVPAGKAPGARAHGDHANGGADTAS